MKNILIQKLYHFTVYAVGILVLTAAILVTGVRLALPDIGSYRSEVEAWVSNYSDFPVVFHSIDASWQGWIPQLTLTDIDLLNKAGTQPIIHFENAIIRIAPLATILERRFVPKSLMISGFELSVSYLSNGSIYLSGIRLEGGNSNRDGRNELAEWFFNQDEIEIRNALIEWKDLRNQQDPIVLTDVALTMRNDSDRFQIDGSAHLPTDYGNKLDFAFDAFGDLMTAEWSGELYLSGSNINPDNWYANFRPLDFNLAGGTADIQVWSNWSASRLSSLEGQMQYDDFAALAGGNQLQVKELAYRFRGDRSAENHWNFQVQLEKFVTENGAWPEADIVITTSPVAGAESFRYDTRFSYLKLDDLNLLISNSPLLPAKARKYLAEAKIQGELKDGWIIYDPSKDAADQFSIETRFTGLTTGLDSELPAFINLSGTISGTPDKGFLQLDTDQVELQIPAIAEDPIRLRRLSGNINWEVSENEDWYFHTNLLRIATRDLNFSLAGDVRRETTSASTFIDLIMDMEEIDLETLVAYLPLTERFRLRSWLEKVLAGGTVHYANAVFRGYLADFPFDNNNGTFKFIAGIGGATLDYSDYWPPVDDIDGELLFEGRTMQIRADSGRIYNAEITDVQASIPDILVSTKDLAIEGHINGTSRDLKLFIEQSPLYQNPSLRELAGTIISGGFGLDLDLAIPLKQPGRKAAVQGHMDVHDVLVTSTRIKNLSMDRMNGSLSFTNDSVSTEAITAEYLGAPVTVAVTGRRNDPDNPYAITISGDAETPFIVDRIMDFVPPTRPLEQELLARIQGQSDWQARIVYGGGADGSALQRTIEISSSLKGLSIDLPAPIGKDTDSELPLRITTAITESPLRTTRVELADLLRCEFYLDRAQEKPLQNIQLNFGGREMTAGNEHAMEVHGAIEVVSLHEWLDLFAHIASHYGKQTDNPLLNDLKLDLQVTSLEMFNRNFSEVNVLALKTREKWNVDLDSAAVKGTIRMPAKLERTSLLEMDLERLHLSGEPVKAGSSVSDPMKIPALDVRVADMVYLGREMGELRLLASPVTEGIAIDSFEFNKPGVAITGNGKWVIEDNAELSSFDIELQADQWDTMLQTLGYEGSVIKDGETRMRINADWSGSPMDFALKKLNGKLVMDVFQGQFLHANPTAGRLFGLLSIQALPRRLLLDFRDLFGKGLSFDKIEGSFEIDQGNAYTNNLYMRGPAADIAVSGRTGLAEKDYDQIVTVTPQISDSLPLAGAVFGPVGIGVGAVFYLVGEMFNSIHTNIDKILSAQYTITGSWNEPVIEKIKDKAKPPSSEQG
ncbi:MAG: TIGR02099 family protein [Gammaproteobacteria bacterium RIFCSPLOWO2_02_FULL_56_15]|nr:MAG: TIGR02099 family protein [Gammaproteobacteria bacterium RIFCSPLOWO2_02_FULL_56_15]